MLCTDRLSLGILARDMVLRLELRSALHAPSRWWEGARVNGLNHENSNLLFRAIASTKGAHSILHASCDDQFLPIVTCYGFGILCLLTVRWQKNKKHN